MLTKRNEKKQRKRRKRGGMYFRVSSSPMAFSLVSVIYYCNIPRTLSLVKHISSLFLLRWTEPLPWIFVVQLALAINTRDSRKTDITLIYFQIDNQMNRPKRFFFCNGIFRRKTRRENRLLHIKSSNFHRAGFPPRLTRETSDLETDPSTEAFGWPRTSLVVKINGQVFLFLSFFSTAWVVIIFGVTRQC